MSAYAKSISKIMDDCGWEHPPATFPKQQKLDELLKEKAEFDKSINDKMKESLLKMLIDRYGCADPEKIVTQWKQTAKKYVQHSTFGCVIHVSPSRAEDFLDVGSHPSFEKQHVPIVTPTELERLCLAYLGYKVQIDTEPRYIHWGN